MSRANNSAPTSPVVDNALSGVKAPQRPQPRTGHSTPNMNGPLYMQTSGSNVILVRRLKRKDESAWKLLAKWFVENQIGRSYHWMFLCLAHGDSPFFANISSYSGLSFNLIALLFLAHAFIPKARDHTAKFFQLSYLNPATGRYGLGYDDCYMLAFCVVLFTGLRASCMEYVLAPIAKSQGVSKRKDLTRFSEQGWLLVYYSVFWTMGMVSTFFVVNKLPFWCTQFLTLTW